MASNDEQRSATTILTTAAQSIAARLIANETTAKFTKAEISTTNLFNQSVTELQVLTSLDNVQQTADINTVTVINNNTVNVNVAIDQTKAPNNYQMNSVGLFAVDGDGKEVLYSVTVLKDPVYIHQDAMGSALGIDLETVVGQASNVEISVNPAGAVTNEILKATLADYVKTDDVKSLIPATVIDGSKPADFKEPVTLEKGAVDGAGNAIATTKDVFDGDAETLTSARAYADTKISGKADDSAVVHTADMRKPASDVAGIEEVNAKQDAIAYTPADDAKVVHNSGLATMPTDNSGLVVGNNGDIGLVKQIKNNGVIGVGSNNVFSVVQSNNNFIGIADTFHDMFKVNGNYQISLGPGAYFTPADDSKVVHTADMRKPASDVAGIEEVNTKQDKLDYTPANAANVVDRNPDTGVVSEPTDFTKLTVNGGKSVATSDDLKSLEASAWRQLDNKYIVPASRYTLAPSTTILYKIDDSIHKLYLSGSIALTDDGTTNIPVTVQLGSIIKSILTVSVPYFGYSDNTSIHASFTHASNISTNLTFHAFLGVAGIVATAGSGSSLAYVTYDELV
ncbi:hypothetical protein ABR398_00100 [Levilactobacillus brevis]|uniref:hypothetical protein n=1 Tax=Levilactobacillus brevis TaxID=1580 RepID=UPI00339D03C7